MKAFLVATLFTALLTLAPSTASADLLVDATDGSAAQAEPLTASELADVRGEGTIVRFRSIPRFPINFERVVNLNFGTVSIVGEAGVGITITIDIPFLPDLP